MNRELHIARQGTELGVLTERDTRALLATGFLRAADLYWAEGMADWRPLGELEAAAPAMTGKGAEMLRAAKQKVTSAATTVGDGAANLTRKLKSIAGVGKQQLTESKRRALDDFLPQIQKIVAERVVVATMEAGKRAIYDDAFMRIVFGTAYDCLPRPVRRFVPESVFVLFCMERRDLLIRPTDKPNAPQTLSGTNAGRRGDTDRVG